MEVSSQASPAPSFRVSTTNAEPEIQDAGKGPPADGGGNPVSTSRFSSDVLRQEVISVWNHIVYPRMARKMGWEGVVTVQSRIAPDGTVLEASVIRSSGYGVLDEAALSGVRSHRFRPGEGTEQVSLSFRFRLKNKENE